MRKQNWLWLAAILLFLFTSCHGGIQDPVGGTDRETEEKPTASVEKTEVDTEKNVDPAETESLSVFIDRMYQIAIPAEKSDSDPNETLAPGDLLPPGYLLSVAEGIVGSTVSLSLYHDENDVFMRTHPAENGLTVAIVAANGNIAGKFQPILLILDVTASHVGEMVEDDFLVQGQIRAVCFLDINEYFFVSSGIHALSETPSVGPAASKDSYARFGVDGTVYIADRSEAETIQVIDNVYERMYTRYGVTVP